jgi:hypothetical protein
MEVITMDEDSDLPDVTKKAWALPPYRSPEFHQLFHDLELFKTLPIYKHAVEAGLIRDDEWMGDYVSPAIVKDGRKLSTQQIGKLGELLVQYKLLQYGVESAHLTTDAGVDLVAYSSLTNKPRTIQVKTNLAAKMAGGKGANALDWWFPDSSPADLIALVDISGGRVWLFPYAIGASLAHQNSNGRHHLYMYVDPNSKARSGKRSHTHKFDEFLLENCLEAHF